MRKLACPITEYRSSIIEKLISGRPPFLFTNCEWPTGKNMSISKYKFSFNNVFCPPISRKYHVAKSFDPPRKTDSGLINLPEIRKRMAPEWSGDKRHRRCTYLCTYASQGSAGLRSRPTTLQGVYYLTLGTMISSAKDREKTTRAGVEMCRIIFTR